MTDVQITIIASAAFASIPPTLTALAAVIISLRTDRKVDKVQLTTDGMTEKLVATTREAALREGHKEATDEEAMKKSAVDKAVVEALVSKEQKAAGQGRDEKDEKAP